MSLLTKLFPATVKYRVLCILTLIMLILTIVPAIQFYRLYMQNTVKLMTEEGVQIHNTILNTLAYRGKSMAMLASTVAENNKVINSFANNDRKALLEETGPLFALFKKKYNVNVFHFHKPPATSFLRLHKPGKFGDDLSGFRFTVVEANKTKKPIVGLEKGKFGLSSRAVMPVTDGNTHLGTVEVGIPLDSELLKQIKEIYHNDISLVGKTDNGFKFIAKSHNLTLPVSQFPFLDQLFKDNKTVTRRVSKDGKELVTTYGPVHDFEGNVMAILAVPVDITENIANAKKTVLAIIGLCLGILSVAQYD